MMNQPNGEGTNSILEQWEARTKRTVTLSSGFKVEIVVLNEMALLFGEDGVPNPLMDIIVKNMGQGEAERKGLSLETLMEDPKQAISIRDGLRRIICAVLVNPPLVENGHAHGISVDVIPVEEQMEIFEHIFGRQQVDQARTFPVEQSQDLDITSHE